MRPAASLAVTLGVLTAGALAARICSYTYACPQGDPHPTGAGYRAIAKAVLAVSDYS
jgi:hypothetical protein